VLGTSVAQVTDGNVPEFVDFRQIDGVSVHVPDLNMW
jgi:hypothetical protein